MTKGYIRIIGGKWRGRRLRVLQHHPLRPTPDRIRETVFNWLSPVISGAYCLDAFAGSGAFGLEALSRGAKHTVLVDSSEALVQLLKEESQLFKADNVEIYRAKVPDQLRKPAQAFDLVFLDPPYESDLLLPTCFFLEKEGYLAKDAYLYLEAGAVIKDNDLPSHWQILKKAKAGQVFYHLVQRNL